MPQEEIFKEEEKKAENTYVFETPFEINETQVQFVPDQAEFLDEAKAKEVLKPVAEAILAAPDHLKRGAPAWAHFFAANGPGQRSTACG